MNVNGKVEGSVNVYDKVKLHAFHKYKAKTKEEYQQRLNLLSTWQLAEEAMKHNLKPVSDRKRLIRQLVADFQKAKDAFENMDNQTGSVLTEEKQDKLKELFSWIPK